MTHEVNPITGSKTGWERLTESRWDSQEPQKREMPWGVKWTNIKPVKINASKNINHKRGPAKSNEEKEQPQMGHRLADRKSRLLHSGHRQDKTIPRERMKSRLSHSGVGREFGRFKAG